MIVLFFVIPLGGSFFALLEKIFPKIRISKAASVISFAACFFLLVSYTRGILGGDIYSIVIGNWNPLVGIREQLDSISWTGLLIMYVVSFQALLYTFSEKKYDSSFYFFFLILHAGMAGMLLAADLFNLFVCLEIVGISAYVLISYTGKGRAFFAGFKYLLLSSLGISLFLCGVFIIYKYTGSLYLYDMRQFFSSGLVRSREAAFAVAALIAGIGVRTAFIPYTWLPDAHAYAPHPVSAVLSGVVIKVSFFAVWKLVFLLNLYEVRTFLLWMGVFIAVVGVLRALTQTDFKVLLAWHSVSQMGYIFAGFGSGTVASVTGSMYHAMSHALFKSLLFLSVSFIIIMTGERSLKKISGVGRIFPLAAVLFLAGALSIAGIPPFTGYVSKKLILSGITEHPAAWWLLQAVSAGTVASFIKLSGIFRGREAVFHGETVAGKIFFKNIDNTGSFVSGYAAMTVLALLCLFTGIYGKFIASLFARLIYGSETGISLYLWKTENFIQSAAVIAAGIIIYSFVMSSGGQKLQEKARKFQLSFNTQLVLLLCGFLVIAGAVYFY